MKTITYEQPFNEQIRLCLRLEHLFTQFKQHLHDPSTKGSRLAVVTLLNLLDVVDRPDLKSKLSQLLSQQAIALGQLQHAPKVDPKKLGNFLQELDQMIKELHNNHEKIGSTLQKNAFISKIRSYLHNPGGITEFYSPAFNLWLNQSYDQRLDDLKWWMKEFEALQKMVATVLYLIRDSAPQQKVTAEHGFYRQALDSSLPCQMVCVTLPIEKQAYPEVSLGNHGLAIRFIEPNFTTGQTQQIDGVLEFTLTCCRL